MAIEPEDPIWSGKLCETYTQGLYKTPLWTLSDVDPVARRYTSLNPKYMSDRLREYFVVPDGRGLWKIKQKGGGSLNGSISGRFTTEQGAEAALIRFLKTTNRYGRAIWPGQA